MRKYSETLQYKYYLFKKWLMAVTQSSNCNSFDKLQNMLLLFITEFQDRTEREENSTENTFPCE